LEDIKAAYFSQRKLLLNRQVNENVAALCKQYETDLCSMVERKIFFEELKIDSIRFEKVAIT
jgi:hypothetical protein